MKAASASMIRYPLEDSFGRVATYLRISVTDRCDLHCIYCLPPEGVTHFSREKILRFEEIERIVRVLVDLGVRKVRFTGGEPLLRKDLPALIERIDRIGGLAPLSMTTNATRLEALARPLFHAGLRSVNISIDSLDPERFALLTQGGDLSKVLAGIDAALSAGLAVKLNAVGLPDLTPPEAIRLVEFGLERNSTVRFIEWMPLCGTGWNRETFVPLSDLESALHDHYELQLVPGSSDVAREYRVAGHTARLGFITSLSHPFCDTCNRVRLSATGQLMPCLFSTQGKDLRPLLRGGASDTEIAEAALQTLAGKTRAHGSDHGIPGIDHDAITPVIRTIGG